MGAVLPAFAAWGVPTGNRLHKLFHPAAPAAPRRFLPVIDLLPAAGEDGGWGSAMIFAKIGFARPMTGPTMKRRAVLLTLAAAMLVLAMLAAEYRRRWSPALVLETEHYTIYSTAAPAQTEEIGRIGEALYRSYREVFGNFPQFQSGPEKLKLRLYKDRAEFRRVFPAAGWAEALYRRPYTHQYYAAGEPNPYHWALHEAVHQLNHETAHLALPRWANEGLASYFSTSRVENGEIRLGEPDMNSYPLWWLAELGPAGALDEDIAARRIIPLRALLTESGGPPLDTHFNSYYLHWWSLVHFLMEYSGGRYRGPFLDLLRGGRPLSIELFAEGIGAPETLEREWHQHFKTLSERATTLSPGTPGSSAP